MESIRDRALSATKLGLSLSGGGYRAAAFHLGVLDALEENGILTKVKILSTVSGGSIIGALYCLADGPYKSFREDVYELLSKRTLMSGRDIIGRAFRGPRDLLRPIGMSGLSATLIKTLEARYDKFLYHGAKLRDLKSARPYLMVNATNLGTGNVWVFTHNHMGDIKDAQHTDWVDNTKSV